MTSNVKTPGGTPPGGTELEDPIAELLEGELDLGDDGEALGDLLGAPPPLPPPEEEIMSSAPRPAATRPVTRASTTPPPPALPEAPTDEEVFAGTEEEVDAALIAVFGPSSAPGPEAAPPPHATGEFGEATKIAEVDDELLKQARAEEPRRGPAVVKRSDLTSREAPPAAEQAAAPGEPSSEEATRIADVAEMVAQAQAPEPAPLDDFYDDIEIAAAADEPPAPAPEAPPAKVAPPRRLTQNVFRRVAPPADAPPPEAPRPAAVPRGRRDRPPAFEFDGEEPSIRTVLEQAAARASAAATPPTDAPTALRFPERAAPLAVDDVAERIELYEAELAAGGQPARIHYYLARAYEEAGDTARARAEYEEACHADHRFLPAVRGLRRLCVRLGDHREVLRALDIELELVGPAERPAVAAYRADLLTAIGEQDLARVAFGELTDARADDLRSLLAQMELAYSDDRPEEVIDVCAAAAPLITDPRLAATLHVVRGRLHERGGRDAEAAAAYSAALAGQPDDRGARLGLLRLALRRGDAADAEEAAALAGTHDAALAHAAARRRASWAIAAGDPAAAARHLEEVQAFDDPLVLEQVANAYLAVGQTAAAALALQSWATVEPAPARRAEVLRLLSALQGGALGDHSAALAALREAAVADPADVDLMDELAGAEEASGNTDAAVALLRQAAADDPPAAAPLRLRAARLLEGAGRLDDAILELTAARVDAPLSPPVGAALGRLLERGGRHAELAEVWTELAEIAPEGEVTARARAARAATAAAEARTGGAGVPIDAEGQAALAAAETAWRDVLAVAPTGSDIEAWEGLVRLAALHGNTPAWADALAGLQGATADPVRGADLALRRAALLGLAPDDEGARAGLDAAAQAGDPRATALLLDLLGQAGQWDEVGARLAARADILPPGPERDASLYRAAALWADAGDEGRAAEVLAPLAAARPTFAGALVRLERAFRRLGDAASLAALLERDMEADGDDPLHVARLLRLAEVWSWRVGDAGRAAAAYREALALRPGDPITRDGFNRVAAAAEELSPLAELALADLRRAEEAGAAAAKVDAYEELARIDGDLRGDLASATLAWEAAVTLDPTRMPTLRALERTYLSESREEELAAVCGKIAAAVGGAESVPILLERARLEERLGRTHEAMESFGAALSADAASRPALFRLEARAHQTGGIDLAALEERVADYFFDDPRARATFLVRAGEPYESTQPDDALARYRASADTLPGWTPALRAWRRVALRHGLWADVVVSAKQEAATARGDAERAGLLHLAAVAAMDHAGDLDEAVAALRGVLAAQPLHDDAFARLRAIFHDSGRHAELAELLAARVEIDADPAHQIELHEALAALYRDVLGDTEVAKTHLRAVLAVDRKHRGAVAALAEIAWGQGAWKEAEEALIARARIEEDPAVLKDVFFRLGVIYSDHLPNQHYAMRAFERVLGHDANDQPALEYLGRMAVAAGDFRTALGATERLVVLAGEPAARVRHLHQVAHIYEDGFKDVKRAEEALRRALDADPLSAEALAAVIDHYSRAGDAVTLRMNLDRVLAAMRFRLGGEAWDGPAYRILARALTARGRAGHAGSIETGRCAAELAVLLGAADDADQAVAAEVDADTPSLKTLASLELDETLFHPSVPNGFRQVFRLLYDTLGKRFPADLRRHRVGRAEKLARGSAGREVVATAATELGIADIDVYLSPNHSTLAVELTDPLSVIIPAPVGAAPPRALRFAAARALKLAVSYMAVPSRLSADELGVLLAAIIRQADPQFTPSGLPVAAIAEEAQRLARLIPKRLRDELFAYMAEISGVEFDHRAFSLGVAHTGNRAGLLATGSVAAGLAVLLPLGGHADLRAAYRDPQIEELFRFAVSNEHCELRASL
jgi:hypothetical protein